MLKNIKNVIFDLGEVIIDLDFNKTEQAFLDLLNIEAQQLYNYKSQSPIFDQLETGKISPQQFRDNLREISNNNVDDPAIDAAWNAMLIQLPAKKIKLAQNLRSNYKTFVLSNTNKIHIDYVNKFLLPKHNIKTLDEVFDFVYYSHEIGERKPNLTAYTYIINKHGILPQESLFIDDKLENIEAAEALGIKTWHLTNREDLYQLTK